MTGAILNCPGGPDAVRRALPDRGESGRDRCRCPACGGPATVRPSSEHARKTLLTCWSGCRRAGIVDAARRLGLETWPDGRRRDEWPAPALQPPRAAAKVRRASTPDDARSLWALASPARPGGTAATWLQRRDGGGVWGGPEDTPLPSCVREMPLADFRRWADARDIGYRLPPGAAWILLYRFEAAGALAGVQMEALDTRAVRVLEVASRKRSDRPPRAWKRTVGPIGAASMMAVTVTEGGGPLAICEGPADALAIAWHAGRDAWARGTMPGADALARRLARLRRPVELWPDMDTHGRGLAAARAVSRTLALARVRVTIIDIPAGSDPAAWLAKGGRP